MSKKNKNSKVEKEIVLNDIPPKMEMRGVVEEALPGTLFSVKTREGLNVITTLSGKLRLNKIRILPGDEVVIEVSPYDMSRGRISTRL